jgi:hypothetical protein
VAKKTKVNELVWANEVMEVYLNLGSLPNSRDWSSPSAKHLYEWACGVDNQTKFIADLVPKATALLAKLSPEDVTEAVIKLDMKTIGELQRHLEVAVAASGRDKKDEPPTLEDLLS